MKIPDAEPAPEYIQLKCRNCERAGSQKVMSSCVHTDVLEGEDQYHSYYIENTHTLRLSLCAFCKFVTFSAESHDDGTIFILYPEQPTELEGLPTRIAQAYRAARAVRTVDPNAFAVLLGRLLELVCIDRSAAGKTLHLQLKDLSNKGEIPGPLADMANQLRVLRNIGAHASLGELTESELPILDDLCKAILEYVYVAPLRVASVQQRIEALKKANSL